jgi:vancomycin resistance protein YoaR
LARRVSPSRARKRRRRSSRQLLWRRVAIAIAAIALVAVALGLAFAGSPATLPAGVHIAGVPVGGLTPDAARSTLEARSKQLAGTPVTFMAGNRSWRLKPSQLGVSVNWGSAVVAALHQGDGPAPVRGFYRLGVRIFGTDITPSARAYNGALEFELNRMAKAINRPHREAALHLKGQAPVVIPSQAGRSLDREAAARVIVQSLALLARTPHVELPVRIDAPSVTAADLEPAAAQVRTALSAPVRLTIGPTRYRISRSRIAEILQLPSGGKRDVRIAGEGADAFFVRLQRQVGREPRDADFAVTGDGIRVVNGRVGRAIDVPTTAQLILRAALSPTNRVARIVVVNSKPHVTTADAKAMGIKENVGSYTTEFGGVANRIHNVQLVAHLIDHHLIAPGEEFSFNKTTGDRNASKGFLEAPVIINGELQSGLGGGVCQVSTTVFNAAYEAGLKITARTNHALYISHYPLGRDATVNYPDTDLRFVNDTGHWLLLRTFVGSYSLTVNLYGTSPHRKVVSEAAPLRTTGPAPTKETKDPDLWVGEKVVDDPGSSSLATSVSRKVYDADGKLLYDNTWYSSYRGNYQLIRVGTKPKPVDTKKTTTTTTTATTTTGAVTTGATSTTPRP